MMAAKQAYRVGILTVSDSCCSGTRNDDSGQQIYDLLNGGVILPSCCVIERKAVPDEKDLIKGTLISWADELQLDLVLTTGGTGFSPRDITPEATREVCDRQADALAHHVISSCSHYTKFALLSRATCGIRQKTIIFNLPGSVKGSKECFLEVACVIPHAIDQLRGNKEAVEMCHMDIQADGNSQHVRSNVTLLKSASRPRVSTYAMVSVADALKIVLEKSVHCFQGVELKRFNESVGHVAACDVQACIASPSFRASIKDGYAVLASEGRGIRKILGVMTAGDDPSKCTLQPGGCVRVNTGGPVPINADCVIQVEDTVVSKISDEGEELEIELCSDPKVGVDIREIGCDIKYKQEIIKKRTRITPFECGLMAAAGVHHLSVYRFPCVAVLSTGDELVKPCDELRVGCIVDSNKTTLCTTLKQLEMPYFDAGIAKDNPDDLKRKLEFAISQADVVIVSGGVSMGEKDILKDVLKEDFGAEIHFGRIHMKPGKPTCFATATFKNKEKLIFCLPGNPVSAVVTFHLLVVPCLRKIGGHENCMQLKIKAELGHDVVLDPRPEYHRVSLTWSDDDKPIAHSTGSQMSSRLLSLTEANGLMILPPCSDGLNMLEAGTEVSVLLLDYFAHQNSAALL